jgi:hypothetical protein
MAAQDEIPYHVQAISDLAKDYSAERFRYEIKVCRDVLAKLIAEDQRSDQQRARYRILRVLDRQLYRSHSWVEYDADLLAWVMRNLIELKFWTKFVSESEENATRFLSELNNDMNELYDQMVKAHGADVAKMDKLPVIDPKRVRVEPSEGQESLTWKLACKLIHQTSWLINQYELVRTAEEHRHFFALQILQYGWGIITMFHDINWVE